MQLILFGLGERLDVTARRSLPCLQGRAGVESLFRPKIKSHPLPTSPCEQGEEKIQVVRVLIWLCSLPCEQGRVGEGRS